LKGNISFALSNFEFDTLSFEKLGHIMRVENQIEPHILFSNFSFRNTSQAGILFSAFDTQRLDVPSRILISNLTVHNAFTAFESFITVFSNTILEISNSTLSRCFSQDKGAVIKAGFQRALVTIKHSIFEENVALEGGVFNSLS
jgi:hypothetical protein